MRHPILFSILAIASMGSAPCVSAAPSPSTEYHIVLPRRAITAGERITLRLAPPPPTGVRLLWWVQEETAGTGLQPYGVYTAPYIIPAGTPSAKVTAALTGSGIKKSVQTEIQLVPGSLPGAEDCLGPGQVFSTVTVGFDSGITLPSSPVGLIHRVDPDYPR